MQLPLVSLALLVLTMIGVRAGAYSLSLPGCPDKCGNMSIPYPFGTKQGCYLNSGFLVTCNDTYNPPKTFYADVFPITEIMLFSGELRSWLDIVHQCFSSDGTLNIQETAWFTLRILTLSYSKNKFTVVGCDASAQIQDLERKKFRTGCTTSCERVEDVIEGSCAGIGCCQISVPKRIRGLNISFESRGDLTNLSSINLCSYAFVVEESAYNFTSLDFTSLNAVERLPVIFDWAVGKKTCEEEASNLCGKNSDCHDYDNGPGYRCNCSKGYQGNPYLPSPNVKQTLNLDINECSFDHPCSEECINTPGSFTCSPCQKGYRGDGYRNGTSCVHLSSKERVLGIALGSSLGISALLLAAACCHWRFQKRKLIQLRKKHFKENGGLTLQQLLAQHEREITAFKIFSAEELKSATHNYDESRILGQGGQGTVFKGELPDTTIIAVKKSNAIDKSQVQQFVNEVVVLSQTNHRNVVKLLGCCLETEIPMLVYEFITNGTLFNHIQRDHIPQLPWQTRLRIAAEIAGALSYLHSATAIPIIHRDIKTTNILLDESYTAKISDFGTSKFAPVDRTSLTTLVQGTFGYLDPEYFYSSQLTEKSDVYSFGVVLVELLTGEKAVDFERREEERSLAMYFVSSMKDDRLNAMIDENLKRQVSDVQQVTEVALIAAKCLNVKGEDRPSMKEVAMELEGLAKKEMHPWVEVDLAADLDIEVLLTGHVRSDSISR